MNFREFVAADKPWKSSKDEITRMWTSLRPYLPLQVQSISAMHRGRRYAEDGIRITGTAKFINSVLSRLKDFLEYERWGLELDVEYRRIKNKVGESQNIEKYVCYIHVIQPKPKKLPSTEKQSGR
jgi:hypothetical protein